MEEDSLARFLNPPFFSFAEMETRLPTLAQGPRRPAPGMPGGPPANVLTRALSKMRSFHSVRCRFIWDRGDSDLHPWESGQIKNVLDISQPLEGKIKGAFGTTSGS